MSTAIHDIFFAYEHIDSKPALPVYKLNTNNMFGCLE